MKFPSYINQEEFKAILVEETKIGDLIFCLATERTIRVKTKEETAGHVIINHAKEPYKRNRGKQVLNRKNV